MARTGRRPGTTQTREQILDAARELFAESGYDATSVRGIARRAGVDPALVHHFFGAKDRVFIAAMRLPYNPSEAIDGLLADPEHDLAEGLLRLFLGVWEDPETRAPVLAFVRSATTNERAARAVQGFLREVILGQIARKAGISPLRASAVASQLFGAMIARYVVGMEPLASADPEEIVRLYAPAIRAVLEGDDAPDSP